MQRELSLGFIVGSLIALACLSVAASLSARQAVSGAQAAVVPSSTLEPPPTATDSPTATTADTDTPTSTSTPTDTSTDTPTSTSTSTPTRKAPTATHLPTRRPPTPVPPPPPLDAARQRVLDLTNANRTSQGLAPLRLNQNLINSASWFAGDMAARNVMNLSHVDSLGRDAPTRISAFGYPWTYYGENLAMGYPSADAVVAAWMGSAGHRENIMNGIFTEIGIGHAVLNGRDWWVQDFGRR